MGRGGNTPTNGGGARLTMKEDKDNRALVFMLERVSGKSIEQISKKYEVSRVTVSNYLQYARDHQIVINEARHLLGDQLIPLAIAVYEMHLRQGSLEAAQDLLFGTGILHKNSTVKHESADANDTLDAFRDAFFKAKAVVEQKALPSIEDAVLVSDTSHEPIQ